MRVWCELDELCYNGFEALKMLIKWTEIVAFKLDEMFHHFH